MKKLYLISIAVLLSLTGFCQTRPNRFTTNGDPGAWVFLPMPALTAYANGTNYFVDWTTNSYRVQGTGDVCFQFSTNWGLPGTNRFANIYFPATNTFRHIFFANAATNWHNQTRPILAVPTGYAATIKLQSYGSGETNVVYTPDIDTAPQGTNWQANFLPSSIGGLSLWWEMSQTTKMFEDEYGGTPIRDGGNVRRLLDLSATVGAATNKETSTGLVYRTPNNSPGNIPALNFTPAASAWLETPTFTALTQPNWCFMVFYGRGGGLAFLDGLSEGNRFACIPSETPSATCTLYSGSSLNFTPGPEIEWRLFSFLQNSTTSIIRTNGVQAASGNSGTQTPSRWMLGSDYPGSPFTGNSYLAELLVYHATLTAQQVTNIETYLWNKYGLKHP